jgi:hypothetical protein
MTTITVPRAVLEQALEALDEIWSLGFRSTGDRHKDAITALRAALAQEEQEQDAEAWVDKGSIAWLGEQRSLQRRKVRSRREWQSLSEEERDAAIRWAVDQEKMHFGRAVARAIEQALKEKNA